ncbi:MAG: NTP transferase domain-containing protein [Oscillospiraceae bacterium]|nr:NTP transferase domain-containing protein [Oscillospiraceae bacterium]
MKAVIMAGGEGSRLRPLTCNLPKPLARLCGRPVLEYIFDLLLRHGVNEAALTLGYLAGMVEEQYGGGYRQLRLAFVTEEKPLGTAGGVALAARGWDEPFFVLSGDAMCDLDLSCARRQHERTGAAVTILGVEVEDPREYGLMQADAENRVTRFVEKPAWGQVTTSLANTGIYLLRPDVMRLVPEGRPFDFAKDLFPQLMARGEEIYCCPAEGYWCDIGDLGAYLRCQRDMLERKVQCALPAAPQDCQGAYLRGSMPQGDYDLVPPVYIGEEVEIAPGAVVGPYAVIDDGCAVGERAKIRGSVLLQNASVSTGASLTGAIVCAGASVRRDAQLFEGCAVGDGATVGAGAVLQPEAAVWPRKQVESGAVARGHVKYGNQPAALFGDGGIGGAAVIGGDEGAPLTPETCAALGAAAGSVKSCKKAGVACDGTGGAKALALALMGGLMSSGSHVWSFGDCFEAQLPFFTGFCGLGLGLYVRGGREPSVRMCGEGGLPVPRYLEREIETRLRRGDFHRCAGEACKEIADMSSIRMMYGREMMKQAPEGLEGIFARAESPNPAVQDSLEDTLSRLGCGTGRGPQLILDGTGVALTAEEDGQRFSAERLLAVCCQHEFRQGCDVALPYDAPETLDALAAHAGQGTLRYLSSPADQGDSAARRLSARQVWVRDGLFRAVKLLAIVKETGLSIAQLAAQLPPFYVESKSFALPCPPSMLQKLLAERDGGAVPEPAREGIVLRKQGGRILVTPGKSGRRVSVLAEAQSMEAAKELCEGIERILK